MNGPEFSGEHQTPETFPFLPNLLPSPRRGRRRGWGGGVRRGLLLRWRRGAGGRNPGRQYALEASTAFPYLRFKSVSVSTVPVPLEIASFAVKRWESPSGSPGMTRSGGREGLSLEAYSCPGNGGQFRMSLCSSTTTPPTSSGSCDCGDCGDCSC